MNPIRPVSLALILICAGSMAAPPPAMAGERPMPPSGDPSGTVFNATVKEKTPDRSRREDLPDVVVQVRRAMQEAYEIGLEAYQAGRFDEAREHFDQAVDVILSSDIDLNSQPALRGEFDEIVRNISDMDVDRFGQISAEDHDDRSPLDHLKDITTHLSPEEAEEERRKIQQVAGQISYDIPIVLNEKVLSYVDAFQTRLRKEFEGGLRRSGAYLPLIKKIFREEGLPEDLAYMAHQESAFKNNAYSRARAKGMWQFMSFTGRRYGLRRDLWVDERSDFEKATRAAAGYLKDLYARYGDWYLAMAAYNAGEGKIDRAIRGARTRDYWEIARTRYIRRETKYYVPAILASILIDKSPEDYGFDVEVDPELVWDTITIDRPTDLKVIADAADVPLKTIQHLNPELRRRVTPPNVKSYTLRVPRDRGAEIAAKLEALPDHERVSWTLHRVQRGETFGTIARRHRVPLRALLDANPRYRPRSLPKGALLIVPLSGGVTPDMLASGSAAREDHPRYEPGERVVHRVRRGETLQKIARKYRTTVTNMKRWNNVSGSIIYPGQRLVAYYGERGHRSVPSVASSAPAAVRDGRLEYRVQRGDSLWIISRKFGVTLDDLYRWNNMHSRSVLRPGETIMVGDASSGESGRAGDGREIRHRVRRGETLYHIARKYSVSVQQVRRWNNLYGTSMIYPGQLLTIRLN